MSNKIQGNPTPSWGIYINHEKAMRYPSGPQWIKAVDRMTRDNPGIIIWNEAANRVMCLLPHQALR